MYLVSLFSSQLSPLISFSIFLFLVFFFSFTLDLPSLSLLHPGNSHLFFSLQLSLLIFYIFFIPNIHPLLYFFLFFSPSSFTFLLSSSCCNIPSFPSFFINLRLSTIIFFVVCFLIFLSFPFFALNFPSPIFVAALLLYLLPTLSPLSSCVFLLLYFLLLSCLPTFLCLHFSFVVLPFTSFLQYPSCLAFSFASYLFYFSGPAFLSSFFSPFLFSPLRPSPSSSNPRSISPLI